MDIGNGKCTLTNSALNIFRSCPKKYFWRYKRQIEPIIKPEALTLGSLVHQFLESHYNGLPFSLPSVDNLSAANLAILEGVIDNFEYIYPREIGRLFDVLGCELKIGGEIANPENGQASKEFKYAGKIDGIIQLKKNIGEFRIDDVLLFEHKTIGKTATPVEKKLLVDTQTPLYIAYLEKELGIKVAGVLYNTILKPGLRQKKDETSETFCDRLRLAMADPQLYQRHWIKIPNERKEEILSDIWNMQLFIKLAEEQKYFPMYPGSCFAFNRACDYFQLCTATEPDKVIAKGDLYRSAEANIELVGADSVSMAEIAEPF